MAVLPPVDDETDDASLDGFARPFTTGLAWTVPMAMVGSRIHCSLRVLDLRVAGTVDKKPAAVLLVCSVSIRSVPRVKQNDDSSSCRGIRMNSLDGLRLASFLFFSLPSFGHTLCYSAVCFSHSRSFQGLVIGMHSTTLYSVAAFAAAAAGVFSP